MKAQKREGPEPKPRTFYHGIILRGWEVKVITKSVNKKHRKRNCQKSLMGIPQIQGGAGRK